MGTLTCWALHLFHFSIVHFSTLWFQKAACLLKCLHGGGEGGHCGLRVLQKNLVCRDVMLCSGLNVAGQHFCVVTQLFYMAGIWGNVHSKLKLSIKVQTCVSVFYSKCLCWCRRSMWNVHDSYSFPSGWVLSCGIFPSDGIMKINSQNNSEKLDVKQLKVFIFQGAAASTCTS